MLIFECHCGLRSGARLSAHLFTPYILYGLSLDIVYTPARESAWGWQSDGMEDYGYSRTTGTVCGGGNAEVAIVQCCVR